jgi:Zn-dependent M28 family amino/carboxypeptidase
LEAARVLAQHAVNEFVSPLPCTIRFVFWGVEEIGLLGSRQYAEQHKEELANMRFYLNMDAAGSANNTRDIILNEWEELEGVFSRYGKEMVLDYQVAQSLHAFSDHFPFFMQGVPTGGMESARRSTGGRGYGHTYYDTVDKVNLADLRGAAALAARVALRVAGEKDWPVKQRSVEEVTALLDGPDYREEKAFRAQVDALYKQKRE